MSLDAIKPANVGWVEGRGAARSSAATLVIWTFIHDPETDTLTDSFGAVWTQEGADPTPSSIPTASSMVRWPQSSLAEVQEAQDLADAGEAEYTWQLEPNMESILTAPGQVDTPEILARFVREELGWEEFVLFSETGDLIESQGRTGKEASPETGLETNGKPADAFLLHRDECMKKLADPLPTMPRLLVMTDSSKTRCGHGV